MKSFTLKEINNKLDGNILLSSQYKKITNFISMPNSPQKNCLYFVRKKNLDEDALIKRLLKHKSSGIIIEKPHNLNIDKWENSNLCIIEVSDRQKSYESLASLYRPQFDIPIVQVVGSSGKTTTKAMLGHILNEHFNTLVGLYNYNAPEGVAYNIFRLNDSHKAGVFEVGMRNFGVMRYSSNMLKANIGIITCIHRAHFEKLGGLENIIKAKSEFLECLSSDGFLLVNGEDKNCAKLPLNKYKGEILKFGFSDKFDIWASDIRYKDFKTYFRANIKDSISFDCCINTFGSYNIGNALSSIMVALKLGLNVQEIVSGLSKFKPLGKRLEVVKGIRACSIINDNFNANPDSTKLLIKELAKIYKNQKLILLMGDMNNPKNSMKEYCIHSHYDVGKEIAKLKNCKLIACGKWSEHYINGAIDNGMSNNDILYFENIKNEDNVKNINNYLLNNITKDCIVVFKASESYINFHHIINFLKI